MNSNRLPSFSSKLRESCDAYPADTVYTEVKAANARFDIFYSPDDGVIEVYSEGDIFPDIFSDSSLVGIEFSPEYAERLVKILNRLFSGKTVTAERFFKVANSRLFELNF